MILQLLNEDGKIAERVVYVKPHPSLDPEYRMIRGVWLEHWSDVLYADLLKMTHWKKVYV